MVTRTLASGTFYLRYDPENRLVAVDRQDGEALARSAEFGYDGDGNRVLGVVTGTSAVRTVYVGAYYEWVEGPGARRYYTHAGKRVATRDTDGALHFLLSDQLGSTAVTVNDIGARTGELRYAAWGETRHEWGTTPTSYRFTGQRAEDLLGLYFYNARWYDPALGRFAQPDSVVSEPGDAQTLNRFSYALNGPLRYADPTGHDPTGEGCPSKLTAEQLEIVQRMAEEFGIPAELLAAVLNTERVYDTEWYDLFQNWYQQSLVATAQGGANPGIRMHALVQMAVWEIYWKPGAEGVGPGLGLGHAHTGPAREVESYFQERGLADVLPSPGSTVERWETLLSDEGNVRYVAASVRRIVEIRQGGERELGKITPSEPLSVKDTEIIMDAYWWGVATRYGTGGYAAPEFRAVAEARCSNGLLIDCSYDTTGSTSQEGVEIWLIDCTTSQRAIDTPGCSHSWASWCWPLWRR